MIDFFKRIIPPIYLWGTNAASTGRSKWRSFCAKGVPLAEVQPEGRLCLALLYLDLIDNKELGP
jgi:hypothetical protein